VSAIADLQQRRQALDPQQSFIVSAPAGSGKTGLITQRVLRLLCTVDNPEEILSITFTRKAAREMASRIHSALRQATSTPRPADEYEAQTWDLASAAMARNHQLGWNLLELPGRLRIQTIDGFCRYIASQFALETRFGPIPEPSEQPQIHYQAAARALLERIEESSSCADHLAVLLSHTGNDLARCETLLSELLGKREQWLPLIYNATENRDYFQQVIEQIVTENLLNLEDALQPVRGELIELVDFAARHVPAEKNTGLSQLAGIDDLPEPSMESVQQWKVLLGLLVTKELTPRKSVTIDVGFPKEQKETKARMTTLLNWCRERPQINELIANVMHLPEAEIDQKQQAVLNALGYLLPLLAAQLDVIFQQQGQCDYPAITLAALNALEPAADDGAISDITLRLDYQLQHILVDEFQDTSAAQIKLLEQLIAGWQADDGRTLFLVGDAMQSLYGFRNANVGLFLNAQRHPVGPVQCTPLALSSNFRSQQGIIDWVNQAFSRAFPATADISRGAIPYSPSTAIKAASEGAAVSFQGFAGDNHEVAEADYIANLCTELVSQHPRESIAILVRGRGHLRTIVPALREANLHWQAIDITKLASRMSVMDLLSITRALLSPADRIAWLAVLRAPFCGLNMADLLTISNYHYQQSGGALLEQLIDLTNSPELAQLSAEGSAILLRVAPLLEAAWQNRGRVDLRNAVEKLWVELGGPATLMGSGDLSDARSYLDLLESWQQGAGLSDWTSFQLAVDKLYAAPSPDSSLSSTTSNQPVIQIMTIHKAKGLEFDHVILPGLSRGSGSDKKPLLRWQQHIDEHSQASLIMAPLGAHDEEDDSVYRYLKREDSLKTRLESTRVLYVAATRAVRKLYLCGAVKPGNKDNWQAKGNNTLLTPIWQSIESGLEQGLYSVIETDNAETSKSQTTDAAGKVTEAKASLRHIRRLDADYNGPDYSKTSVKNSLLTGDGETATEITSSEDASLSGRARAMGTVLHRTLKQIANEGIDNWPSERLDKLPTSWTAQLKELGILVRQDELDNLLGAVQTMLTDQRGRWILQPHKQAACEQALGYQYSDSGRIGTSVIDRTFIDESIIDEVVNNETINNETVKNSVRWIIDYKFSQPAEGESLTQFSRRQISAYSAQLNHYATLYRSLEPNLVRCALYFPQIPMFIELEAE